MKTSNIKRKVVLIGPPGCGKNTFMIAFRALYDCGHISPGECARNEIERKTELGKVLLGYTSKRELVPNPILHELLAPPLEILQEKQVLFMDGFPRRMDQVGLFYGFVDMYHFDLIDVIHVETPIKVCIERIQRRALEERRIDDTDSDVIARGIEVFNNETRPVIEYFEKGDGKHRTHFQTLPGSSMKEDAPAFVNFLGDQWGLNPLLNTVKQAA